MLNKIYKVKVVPRAKQNRVDELSANELKVWLTAPPVDNKANFLLIKILADYFKVKQRQVLIVGGVRSKDKQIKVINS